MKLEVLQDFKALKTNLAGSTLLEHFLFYIPGTKNPLHLLWNHNSSLSCHSSRHQQTYQHVHGARTLLGLVHDVEESLAHSCKKTILTVGSIFHEPVRMNSSLGSFWPRFSQAYEHFGDPQELVSYKTFFGSSCMRKFEVLPDYEVMMKKKRMARVQVLGLVDCLVGLDVERCLVGNPWP